MSVSNRSLHRVLAPWLFILLFVSLATGMGYRLGKAWFGLSRPAGDWLMTIHAGDWLGETGSMIYILLVGGGLLALLVTGGVLLFRSRAKAGMRVWHRVLGAILLLPLTATAVSGILYKVGEDWFGFSPSTEKLLMVIHEGRWLGREMKLFYVLFVGVGLLVLGLTGLRLTKWFARWGKAR